LINQILNGAKSMGADIIIYDLNADAIETTNNFLKAYGWDVIESLLVYRNVAENYTLAEELLDRAYEVGKELTKAQRR